MRTRLRSGCWSPGWRSWNTGPEGCSPAREALPSRAAGTGCAGPRSAGRTSAGGASCSEEPGAAAAGGGDGGGGGCFPSFSFASVSLCTAFMGIADLFTLKFSF